MGTRDRRTRLSALVRHRFSRYDAALVAFAPLAAVVTQHFATKPGHAWLLAVVPVAALALVLRSRPELGALAMIAASVVLRVGTIGISYSDQLDAAHAAARIAFSGGNPYGAVVFNAAPYPYGPLGLVWWLGGVPLEFAAAVGSMLLLWWLRAWISLAVVAVIPFGVDLTLTGANDYSVGLLLTVALLVVRRRPVAGAALLAVATAIKPYGAAWFLPVAGYAGLAGVVTLAAASVILWLPVLVAWTPVAFVRSALMAEELHREIKLSSAGSIDIPALRLMALPISAVGLLVRDWRRMVLLGSATFFVFLFFSPWTSGGYWVALIPITGIALELGNSWEWAH